MSNISITRFALRVLEWKVSIGLAHIIASLISIITIYLFTHKYKSVTAAVDTTHIHYHGPVHHCCGGHNHQSRKQQGNRRKRRELAPGQISVTEINIDAGQEYNHPQPQLSRRKRREIERGRVVSVIEIKSEVGQSGIESDAEVESII